MPRINPLSIAEATPSVQAAFEHHITTYKGRITNMKATLGRSLVAFEVYMGWYPLYEEMKKFTSDRLAYLYAHSISLASNCPLCTMFFRKIIIENGEKPEDLVLTEDEQLLLDFGSAIAQNKGELSDEIYNSITEKYNKEQIVILVAFAGQMIATNIFNNVLEVKIDDYLIPYLPLTTV